ncbi:MAG: hypothetical protein SXQ77_09345, partial [Halobacteria archaeon]|nr:hypothetical protein [Halobacteria archaeon]
MTDENMSDTEEVQWDRLRLSSIEPPVCREVEYVELKLEHSGVEPEMMNRDFPTGVPYTCGSEERVFFWREFGHSGNLQNSNYVYATPYELGGISREDSPKLSQVSDLGGEIVVEGTVAGVSKTVCVDSYGYSL